MQTCSLCNASAPDGTICCPHCEADLRQFSESAVALRKFQNNPRVKAIRITVAHDACSHCHKLMQTYPKDAVPSLPHQGCSHENGCRCFYEPVLSDISII